ncbi:hypothetical protein SBRCBS47491_001057 [Sporothrix bragantina]|uniref:Uncharacterized protein n=1 Tax=Sporothrix bragantina TaxID=671064 RepID=A0ABP0AVL7_9PEZI
MATSILYRDSRDVVRTKVIRLTSMLRCAAMNPALFNFKVVESHYTPNNAFTADIPMVHKQTQRVLYKVRSLGDCMYQLSNQAEDFLKTLDRIQTCAVTIGQRLDVSYPSSSYSSSKDTATVASTTPTTFHGFSTLPRELQLMIWDMIPCPVACQHYIRTVESLWDNARMGFDGPYGDYIEDLFTAVLPATHLLGDWGAWRACADSRNVMARAYDECHMKTLLDDCERPGSTEDHYFEGLAHLNVHGAFLQQDFYKLYAKFRVPLEMQYPPLTLINSLFSPTMSDEWLAFMEHVDTTDDFAWCLAPFARTATPPLSYR